MKFFPIFSLIILLLTAEPLLGQTAVKAFPLPNIILIMCDDLGWGDVGFNGNTHIQTPNLDRLAKGGIIFSRFYSAGPVCSPTRASVLTGRNPYRMGIEGANKGHMKPEEITLPELLRTQGYATGHFGKWHLGTLTAMIHDSNRGTPRDYTDYSLPTANGYDEYFCSESKVPTWDPLFKPDTFNRELGESLRYGWAAMESDDDARSIETYGTNYWKGQETLELTNVEGDDSRIVMDRVIPFIRGAANSNRPFFGTVWFHTPHLPLVTNKAYRDRYKEFSHQEQLLYGAITAMDEQVGRLWAELESMGISDNTMLWFCSDNGPEINTPGSAGPFRERKRSLYEGGVRVPSFCIWPKGIKPGQTTDIASVTSDYLPTILDLLDMQYPDSDRPLDGKSLVPALMGKEMQRNSPIGFQHRNGRISWVTDRYKLIKDSDNAPFELYDLIQDKSETKNIIAENSKLADTLIKELMEWKASCANSSLGKDY